MLDPGHCTPRHVGRARIEQEWGSAPPSTSLNLEAEFTNFMVPAKYRFVRFDTVQRPAIVGHALGNVDERVAGLIA